jgi:hypothetical protein
MKKFILGIDGYHYHPSTVKFAIECAKMTHSHLTGIMLDDHTYSSYKIYEVIIEEGISEKKLKAYKEKDLKMRKTSSAQFEADCKAGHISFNVHHDKDFALDELLQETLFADLLFLSIEDSFSHHEEKSPPHFIKQVLLRTSCPVIICPNQAVSFDKVIFLYDGSESSVFSMKQYALLFPEQLDRTIEIISVRAVDETNHLPHHGLIKEWLTRHFKHISIRVLKGIPENELLNYLQYQSSKPLIVAGAYGRNVLSRWIKPSLADMLLDQLQMPVFIAHKN